MINLHSNRETLHCWRSQPVSVRVIWNMFGHINISLICDAVTVWVSGTNWGERSTVNLPTCHQLVYGPTFIRQDFDIAVIAIFVRRDRMWMRGWNWAGSPDWIGLRTNLGCKIEHHAVLNKTWNQKLRPYANKETVTVVWLGVCHKFTHNLTYFLIQILHLLTYKLILWQVIRMANNTLFFFINWIFWFLI